MSGTVWLTRSEAAAYVKKTVNAFDCWVRSRGIKAEGRAGRLPLYTREQLDRVLRFEATRRSSSRSHVRRFA